MFINGHTKRKSGGKTLEKDRKKRDNVKPPPGRSILRRLLIDSRLYGKIKPQTNYSQMGQGRYLNKSTAVEKPFNRLAKSGQSFLRGGQNCKIVRGKIPKWLNY